VGPSDKVQLPSALPPHPYELESPLVTRGKWLALTAALLGWLFDGLEMGLFPLVGRPALRELLGTIDESKVSLWFGIGTAAFLVGAATGGVLFGWLGDRLGRVRAMTLSVLTYAIFSGLCGFTTSAHQVVVLRFLSALGMGGEWSLGVALVMEIWPNRNRAFLAGLIGAAANLGYMLIGLLSLGLGQVSKQLHNSLLSMGMSANWVDWLTGNSGWRILMLLGATPALLTFFIRLWVPESARWAHERDKGGTTNWATRDLLGVCVGSAAACAIIYLWSRDNPNLVLTVAGSLLALVVVIGGYLYPIIRYLQRSAGPYVTTLRPTINRMLLGACLSGVALLGTWASIQWAPTWVDELTGGKMPQAKAYTQIWSALGAVVGTILAALLCDWIGRRFAYIVLCVGSLGATLLFYQGNKEYGPQLLACVFLAGAMTASFYGWLPLYLPELFRTNVRATGQGFSFNFGRVIAAIGVLQTGNLTGLFKESGGYPVACSIMASVYLVGVAIIWLAPETKGKPLPE
jgi:MFS transporter, SHS family, sialic acid transporter